MTREDIIRMAQEAVFYKDQPMYYDESMLEAFAKLISEYERKFYMQLFLDSENQPTQFGTATQEYREQEIQEAKRQERDEFKEHALAMARAAIIGAVKNEREACAKVCDDKGMFHEVSQGADLAFELATAIRARGQA